MSRLARVLAAATLLAGLSVGAPASAHSALLASSPADGAVVTTPVDEVTLTFNEPVQAAYSTVVVAGPDGSTYSSGAVSVLDTAVRQAVAPLRSGSYRVAWRVVSADGHPVSGEFTFEVALTPDLEPTIGPPTGSASAPVESSSAGWWLAAAGLGAAVAAGLVIAGRRRP